MSELVDKVEALNAIRAATEPYLTDRSRFVMEGPAGIARAAHNAVHALARSGLTEWQPIETAPKDGFDRVLLFVMQEPDEYTRASGAEEGWCYIDVGTPTGDGWHHEHSGTPTHWQPLPQPPHSEQ